MPGDSFKTVRRGQPVRISADAWNAFLEAARGEDLDRAGRHLDYSTTNILIRNDSGFDLPRFSVLALGMPVVGPGQDQDEFHNNLVWSGVVPDEHLGRFAVLSEPVAAGNIGEAVVSGLTIAWLNVPVGLDALKVADCADGITAYLQSVSGGTAQILWRTGGVGLQWAIVRIGAAGAGITIQDEGNNLPPRGTINFVGAGVSAADDSANARTNVAVGGSYQTIQEEGTSLPQRRTLNFVGPLVTATDSITGPSSPTQNAIVPVAGGTLVDGTTYYYVVTASDGTGESAASNEQSYPATAANLTARISWSAVGVLIAVWSGASFAGWNWATEGCHARWGSVKDGLGVMSISRLVRRRCGGCDTICLSV